MLKHIHFSYLFYSVFFMFLISNKTQACTGRDIIFTSITVTSISSGSYQYSYEIQNIGTTDIAINQLVIQNYVSTDNLVGGDAAAGGSFIDNLSSGIIASGATYSGTMGVSPFPANPQSSYPYIVANIYLNSDPECDVTNNYFVKFIQIIAGTQFSHIANATVNWVADSKSFMVNNWSGNSDVLQYSVYTSSGILMITANTKKDEPTPLNGLQNGLYILYISDGEKMHSKKIVYE